MIVTILDYTTLTTKVVNVSDEDLKEFDGELEEYLHASHLIDSNCHFMETKYFEAKI